MKSKIGKIIREKRKSLGLTQEQLAEDVGVDTSCIGQIERGTTNPGVDVLARITQELMIDANQYFYDESTQNKERQEFYLIYDRLSQDNRELIQVMLRQMSKKDKKR